MRRCVQRSGAVQIVMVFEDKKQETPREGGW
jgi:hypothetical protein